MSQAPEASAVTGLPQVIESTAVKRQYEADYTCVANTCNGTEVAVRKRSRSANIVFRIILRSREIGKVIGKDGCRIQKVREETKANVKIVDAILKNEERMIIISSKDTDEVVCDAQNALHQIVSLILKEDGIADQSGATGSDPSSNAIRLLIAGSQVGSFIGANGFNIEKIRSSSGAVITVLPPNQLPLCASAQESDRVVQISGDMGVILKAIVEIGFQLRENPPREVISLNPAYNYNTIQHIQPYVDPSSAEYVTMEMLIAETMVGALIGRCGSNISRLRNESGATIKVYGVKGEKTHRHILFGGTAQQVAFAKFRVDEFIYSQFLQNAATAQ